MPLYERIKENKDFIKLYRRGKSCVDPLLVTYIFFNKSNKIRVGITATKKIGGAVQRNRAKRVIRAAFREQDTENLKGCDIVFVARTKTTVCKSHEISRVMNKHFEKLLSAKKQSWKIKFNKNKI